MIMAYDKRNIQKAAFADFFKRYDLQVSFEIWIYHDPADLIEGFPSFVPPYTFPSFRAAERYMYDKFPEVYYFNIMVTNKSSKCPEPYNKL